MKQTFFNLTPQRQREVLEVSMREFAQKGYEKASINQIIKELDLAKGSFYNYIHSKEKLYLYIFDLIYYETFVIQNDPHTYKTDDLFDRVEELTRFSMDYCRSHPLEYELMIRAELDTASSFYPKMIALKKEYSDKSLPVLFGNVNWKQYSVKSKDDVIAIFTWLVRGVRDDLSTRVNAKTPVGEYEKIMKARIKLYKDSITKGIYK